VLNDRHPSWRRAGLRFLPALLEHAPILPPRRFPAPMPIPARRGQFAAYSLRRLGVRCADLPTSFPFPPPPVTFAFGSLVSLPPGSPAYACQAFKLTVEPFGSTAWQAHRKAALPFHFSRRLSSPAAAAQIEPTGITIRLFGVIEERLEGRPSPPGWRVRVEMPFLNHHAYHGSKGTVILSLVPACAPQQSWVHQYP